ncbi:MAG: GNAT family N-acetyltransferase [Acidobacteriota bacterium]
MDIQQKENPKVRLVFNNIQVVYYEDRYASEFRRLNYEWLEGFGLLEPADMNYLDAPRQTIIEKGGQIFFAIEDEWVIGTCAVLSSSPTVVELAKLAVTAAAQGRGIGRLLTEVAIDYAQEIGMEKIILVSNSRLVKALRLYESMGFRHTPPPLDPVYASADVYMELIFIPKPGD